MRFGSGANAIIFVGGIHYGYAPASETVALRTIDYFTNNPQKIPENASVYVVKNLNPDAFYDPGKLAGRLNANGVDLNRNWDCNWAKDTEVLGKFLNGAGGSSPFSEPETSSLYDLIITTRPKAVVIWGARGENVISWFVWARQRRFYTISAFLRECGRLHGTRFRDNGR
ncbi:MAG: M14 family metallopeptidase [Chloroflexi bacterium]|nr:M14 family metallopeptidase [Chloroflexota bacterium]